MKYVVCDPVPSGEWGYNHEGITTFEAENDEKAIAIFRRHKWLAENSPQRRSGSFLRSYNGKYYWKNAILCHSGDPKAIAGPADTALEQRDNIPRSAEEEIEWQAYIQPLIERYRT